MQRIVFGFVLCLVTGLMASTSQAGVISTFDFNFAGNGGNAVPGFSAASNPAFNPAVNMTITASATAPNIAATFLTPGIQVTSVNPYQTLSGLGVNWSGVVTTFFTGPTNIPISDTDSNNIDNFGPSETLNLTFGAFAPFIKNGLITNIKFGNVDHFTGGASELLGDDDIRVLINGVQVALLDPSPSGTVNFPTSLAIGAGDVLSFQGVNNANDDFTVLGLTVQAEVVPEPASLAVWSVLSVVGLAAWRKRKLAR